MLLKDNFETPVWLEYPLDLFSTSWRQKIFKFVSFPERKIFLHLCFLVCKFRFFSPHRFVCTYNYKPKKPDELTLIRGEIYCVTERYRDGWCKGYCARSSSKVPGMIPGNYLKPARYVRSVHNFLCSVHLMPAQSERQENLMSQIFFNLK